MVDANIEEAIEEIRTAKTQLETIPELTPGGPMAAFKVMQILVQSHDRLERAITILEDVK